MNMYRKLERESDRKYMKREKEFNRMLKRVLAIAVIVVVVLWATLMCVSIVYAQDETEIGACTNPKAVNFLGWQTIRDLKDAGLSVVDDGSCTCLSLKYDEFGNIVETNDISCEVEDYSYNEYFFGTPIPADQEVVGGCTDPLAKNWMDPQWWPQYQIVENGSCNYEPILPAKSMTKVIVWR